MTLNNRLAMQIRQILFSVLVLGMLMPAAVSFAQGFPAWQWPMQWPTQPTGPAQSSGTTQPSGSSQSSGTAQSAQPGSFGQYPFGPFMPQPGRQRQATDAQGGRGGVNDDAWRNISDRIKADRVVFFTSRISLTPTEAQAFWPIYNEFDAQKDVLYKQRADIAMRYMRNASTLSDKELEQMLTDYWNINQKEYRLSTEYHRKFLSVLSPAKVMRLYMTEEQFKNSYLQRMRGGQGQQGQGRGMAGNGSDDRNGSGDRNGRSAEQKKE